MQGTFPHRLSRTLFLLLCAGVAAAAFVGARYHQARGLPVPEWPLAVDLFLVVPLAYLLLWRPARAQALLGLVALFSLGVLLGAFVLPAEDKSLWLWLEPLRWLALAALVAWQVWAFATVVRAVWRAPGGTNLEQALHAALDGQAGPGPMTELLKVEARMWLYALWRDTGRLRFAEAGAFHVHRQGGNASNQLGFLVIVAVELPIAHALLHLFSPTLAIVVSALTAYGLLFMFADYRATRLRPITVTGDMVRIRYGVLTDLRLPRAAIVEVGFVDRTPRRAAGRMRLVGMGRANLRLRLAPGTRLATPFGTREVAELFIGVDQPQAFAQALQA